MIRLNRFSSQYSAFALYLALSMLWSAGSVLAQVSLKARDLTITTESSDGRFGGFRVNDAISNRTIVFKEAFVLVMKDKTELRSSAMRMSALPGAASVADPHQVFRGTGKVASVPQTSCWTFEKAGAAVDVQWCLIARPDAEYARTLLRVVAKDKDAEIAEVRLLEFEDAGARVDGVVKGSPIVDENMFFGAEHPLSSSVVERGVATASMHRDLPLRAGQAITCSAVVGTSRPGQLRRSFLAYIENERPRPYGPFLHYNSWFDIGYTNRFDEASALDRIRAFGQELSVARHVKLDSFLFDDGWDDPKTLWAFNPGFPNGFAKVKTAAAAYDAGVGVWLSPWGGYDKEKVARIAYGRAHGFEIMNDGYALSGPKYFEQFERTCLEMIDRYDVNQFKLDGTGNANAVFPGSAFDSDFDAAIHLIERLRQEKPSVFVNLTTGTTASPFWLFYADSIWRGGEDHDFSGVGTPRQRWITYRDAQVYKNIVRSGPLFPLNSLMEHGVIYASQAKDLATDPGDDFADEVHSFFGSGTQLQELYMTPSLISAANWDTLAEAAKWSRAHAETLKDVHWIGGDPDKLKVYGWAAWNAGEGIVTLRNPSAKEQEFALESGAVFELPEKEERTLPLYRVWDDSAASGVVELRRGKGFSVHLAPFEVIVLATKNASLQGRF